MKTKKNSRLGQRLHGFSLIIIAISPILLVGAIFITSLLLLNDVKTLIAEPFDGIKNALVEVQENAAKTGAAISKVVDPIKKVSAGVKSTIQAVGRIPTEVRVPNIKIPKASLPVNPNIKMNGVVPNITMKKMNVNMPEIPGFTIPIAGLTQVKEVITDNLDILGDLNNIFKGIPNLGGLRDNAQALVGGVKNLFDGLKKIGVKITIILFLLALIIIPWLYSVYVAPYLRGFNQSFTKGWRLLNGKPIVNT